MQSGPPGLAANWFVYYFLTAEGSFWVFNFFAHSPSIATRLAGSILVAPALWARRQAGCEGLHGSMNQQGRPSVDEGRSHGVLEEAWCLLDFCGHFHTLLLYSVVISYLSILYSFCHELLMQLQKEPGIIQNNHCKYANIYNYFIFVSPCFGTRINAKKPHFYRNVSRNTWMGKQNGALSTVSGTRNLEFFTMHNCNLISAVMPVATKSQRNAIDMKTKPNVGTAYDGTPCYQRGVPCLIVVKMFGRLPNLKCRNNHHMCGKRTTLGLLWPFLICIADVNAVIVICYH